MDTLEFPPPVRERIGEQTEQYYAQYHDHVIDEAVEIPYSLTAKQLADCNRVFAPILLKCGDKPCSPHPIAAIGNFLCEREIAKQVDDHSIIIGGNLSELTTRGVHHCSKIDARDQARMQKHLYGTDCPDQQRRLLLEALRGHNTRNLCIRGVENCHVQANKAFANNVYDITMQQLHMAFKNHNLQYATFYMILPLGLPYGVFNEMQEGLGFRREGNQVTMYFTTEDDRSLSYTHDYQTWYDWCTLSAVQGKEFSLAIERVRSYGPITKITVARVTESAAFMFPLNTTLIDYVQIFDFAGNMQKVFNHAKSFYFSCDSQAFEKHMLMLQITLPSVLLPKQVFSRLIQHAICREDKNFNRQQIGSYLKAITQEIKIHMSTIQPGIKLSAYDFEIVVTNCFLLACILRQEQTKNIAYCLNELKDDESRVLARIAATVDRLLDRGGWYRNIFNSKANRRVAKLFKFIEVQLLHSRGFLRPSQGDRSAICIDYEDETWPAPVDLDGNCVPDCLSFALHGDASYSSQIRRHIAVTSPAFAPDRSYVDRDALERFCEQKELDPADFTFQDGHCIYYIGLKTHCPHSIPYKWSARGDREINDQSMRAFAKWRSTSRERRSDYQRNVVKAQEIAQFISGSVSVVGAEPGNDLQCFFDIADVTTCNTNLSDARVETFCIQHGLKHYKHGNVTCATCMQRLRGDTIYCDLGFDGSLEEHAATINAALQTLQACGKHYILKCQNIVEVLCKGVAGTAELRAKLTKVAFFQPTGASETELYAIPSENIVTGRMAKWLFSHAEFLLQQLPTLAWYTAGLQEKYATTRVKCGKMMLGEYTFNTFELVAARAEQFCLDEDTQTVEQGSLYSIGDLSVWADESDDDDDEDGCDKQILPQGTQSPSTFSIGSEESGSFVNEVQDWGGLPSAPDIGDDDESAQSPALRCPSELPEMQWQGFRPITPSPPPPPSPVPVIAHQTINVMQPYPDLDWLKFQTRVQVERAREIDELCRKKPVPLPRTKFMPKPLPRTLPPVPPPRKKRRGEVDESLPPPPTEEELKLLLGPEVRAVQIGVGDAAFVVEMPNASNSPAPITQKLSPVSNRVQLAKDLGIPPHELRKKKKVRFHQSEQDFIANFAAVFNENLVGIKSLSEFAAHYQVAVAVDGKVLAGTGPLLNLDRGNKGYDLPEPVELIVAKGDLLNMKHPRLHQCTVGMRPGQGGGIAGQLAANRCDPYKHKCRLGEVACDKFRGASIYHAFAQKRSGRARGDESDISRCCQLLRCIQQVKENKLVMPYKIGCGLGGGDWQVVSQFFKHFLPRDKHIVFVDYVTCLPCKAISACVDYEYQVQNGRVVPINIQTKEPPKARGGRFSITVDEADRLKEGLLRELRVKTEIFEELNASAIAAVKDVTFKTDYHVIGYNGVPGSGKTRTIIETCRKTDWIVVTPTRELAQEYRDAGFKSLTMITAIASGVEGRQVILDEFFLLSPGVAFALLNQCKLALIAGDPKQMRYNDEFKLYGGFDLAELSVVKHLTRLNTSFSVPIDITQWLNRTQGYDMSTMSTVTNSVEVVVGAPPKNSPVYCFTKADLRKGKNFKTVASIQGMRHPVVHLFIGTSARPLVEKVAGQAIVALSRHTEKIKIYETVKGSSGVLHLPIIPAKHTCERAGAVTAFRPRQHELEGYMFTSASFTGAGESEKFPTQVETAAEGVLQAEVERVKRKEDEIVIIDDSYIQEGNSPHLNADYDHLQTDPEKRSVPTEVPDRIKNRAIDVQVPDSAMINFELGEHAPYDVGFSHEIAFENAAQMCEWYDLECWREGSSNFATQKISVDAVEEVINRISPSSCDIDWSHYGFNHVKLPEITEKVQLWIRDTTPLYDVNARDRRHFAARLRGRPTQASSPNQTIYTMISRYGKRVKRMSAVQAREEGKALFNAWRKLMTNITRVDEDQLRMCMAEQIQKIKVKGDAEQTREYDIAIRQASTQISCFLKSQTKADVKADSWVRADGSDKVKGYNLKAGQGISAQPIAVNLIVGAYVRAIEKNIKRDLDKRVLFGFGLSANELDAVLNHRQIKRDGVGFEVDISEFDTQRGEWTDSFMDRVYEAYGFDKAISTYMTGLNKKWILTSHFATLGVNEKFQSGRADTLLSNTLVSMAFFSLYFRTKNLKMLLIQGDDICAFAEKIEYIAQHDFFKIMKTPTPTFVGYILAKRVTLDLPRMVIKVLNRVFQDARDYRVYQDGVRQWLGIIRHAIDFEYCVSVNAYAHGLRHEEATILLNFLYSFAAGDVPYQSLLQSHCTPLDV